MGWIIAAVVAIVVVLALLGFAAMLYFHPVMYYPYTGPGYFPFFFFPFGFLVFFLFLFLIFRLVFWRSWGWGYWGHRGYYGMDPKDIIKRRYARGEITKDQYDQMMAVLRSSRVSS